MTTDLKVDAKNKSDIDLVDNATKYLRFICLFCTLLTILSGVILFFISNKVASKINPLKLQIASAENKLNNHITVSSKNLDKIIDKDLFDSKIETIKNDISYLKESQSKLDNKQTILNDKLDRNYELFSRKLDSIVEKIH